jgi:hypothetical protein
MLQLIINKKVMNKKLITYALALLFPTFAAFGQAVRVNNSGDVAVGRINSQGQDRIFDVKGTMFVTHLPDPPTQGIQYSGVYFDLYHWGGMEYPVLHPQWNNRYYLGKPPGVSGNHQIRQIYADYIEGITIFQSSDRRQKANITTMPSSLDKIARLKTYKYDYIFKRDSLLPSNVNDLMENERKNQVGFMAQELLDDFPYLVRQNEESELYSVNYIGFIPEIVNAIQELKIKLEESIDSLKTELATLEEELETTKGNCCSQSQSSIQSLHTNDDLIDADNQTNVLYQNNPNPFNTETNIKYYLAPSSTQATMYIYDLNGKQIDKYVLHEKGEHNIRIQKNKLNAGIYYYTLVVDGKEIATKKMILTD